MFLPGRFQCNELEKKVYIDYKPPPARISRNAMGEESEVVQLDEVVLDSDQVNLARGQGNAEQNFIPDNEELELFGDLDFGISTENESSEQLAASVTLFRSTRERFQGPAIDPSSDGVVREVATAPATGQG